jgi:hypothetical protein
LFELEELRKFKLENMPCTIAHAVMHIARSENCASRRGERSGTNDYYPWLAQGKSGRLAYL